MIFQKYTLTILIFYTCIVASAQDIQYNDDALNLGINHTYILNNSGGGCSFYDFDNDGDDDISLATGQGEKPHFYINENNKFQLTDFGILSKDQHKSIIWADFDNDGDQDVYITAFDGINRLYRNDGNMSFDDITQSAGFPLENRRSFGAVWSDYNRDGWLDVYYTERPNTEGGETPQNRLFQNNGDGTFSEVTQETQTRDEGRLPFCAAFMDYNNDMWPDVYIANDRNKRNTLLRNDKGNFADVSEECNADIEMDAMNVAFADTDQNGSIELYITNTPDGSAFLDCSPLEEDNFDFIDETENAGVGFYGVGWGANFYDSNNNGWQDIYVSGMNIGANSRSSALYTNLKDGKFSERIPASEADTVRSFTNAIGDWNGDGYADIIVNNSEGFSSQLWTSSGGNNNHLTINLEGVLSNRDGVGAKIEVYQSDLYQYFFTHAGIAFMGQNSNNLLIGAAQHSDFDSIAITWPTGHVDRLYNVTTNQKLTITEGQTTNGDIFIDPEVTLLSSNNSGVHISSLQLYPNPASQFLSIDTDEDFSTYEVYNENGKILSKGNIENNIDIRKLPSGNYILRLSSATKSLTERFIKI